jgi:hypothetical protein
VRLLHEAAPTSLRAGRRIENAGGSRVIARQRVYVRWIAVGGIQRLNTYPTCGVPNCWFGRAFRSPPVELAGLGAVLAAPARTHPDSFSRTIWPFIIATSCAFGTADCGHS